MYAAGIYIKGLCAKVARDNCVCSIAILESVDRIATNWKHDTVTRGGAEELLELVDTRSKTVMCPQM